LGDDSKVYSFIHLKLDWFFRNVIDPLYEKTKHKPSFSSSSLLFFGILLEDIPQLIVTFLIEDKIKSDDPTGRISQTAVLNLTLAIFDILHKIAEASDLLNDVHNAGYKYKKRIKAHRSDLCSLTVAGGNRILSASRDETLKLWNTAKGKLKKIREFRCGSAVRDAIAIGSSKIMAACWDRKIRVFNFETGEALGSPIRLDFLPRFLSLSPDSKSVFTSGRGASVIQRFDVETKALLSTYSQPAKALAFLDNQSFVSSSSSNVIVWSVGTSEPIQTIELEDKDYGHYSSVMVMSPTIFLISNGPLIKGFEYDNFTWTRKFTFEGHTEYITSLTKVNGTLFVSTSKTAKVWDIARTEEPTCVFTFLAHGNPIWSSVYLKEEKSIATGDDNGNIVVWSIAKYLGNNQDDNEEDEAQNRSDSGGADRQGTSDQEPITAEP
jgi:WD40 repeat protein